MKKAKELTEAVCKWIRKRRALHSYYAERDKVAQIKESVSIKVRNGKMYLLVDDAIIDSLDNNATVACVIQTIDAKIQNILDYQGLHTY